MDTATLEALKSVFKSTKKDPIMDDLDDRYDTGVIHVINTMMLKYFHSLKIEEIQRTWVAELEKEKAELEKFIQDE